MKICLCSFLSAVVTLSAYGQIPECGVNFEPVLLPLALSSPITGAYGATFTTELTGFNAAESTAVIRRGCDVRNPFIGTREYLVPPNAAFEPLFDGEYASTRNPGAMLHIAKEVALLVRLNLQLQSSSPSGLHVFTTEIPVVRSSQFHAEKFYLLPIVLTGNTRALLRVYEPGSGFSSTVGVRAVRMSDSATLATTLVSLGHVLSGQTRNVPGYAELSLDQLVNERDTKMLIEVEPITEGRSFWAFVSVTDNQTQAVSLVTPQ